ncbi:MAG: tRNA (N(6)-L-threonylcarbamoyladenosine(37)-C(2))-methylthiotransferase [Nanoarchaeota archaeon]
MVKVSFTTQGCSSNMRESELMAGLLDKSGYEVVETGSEVEVINICTVKGDNTALREIRKVQKIFPEKKIVVAGCISDSIIPKIRELNNKISLINTHNLGKISAVVENSMNGTVLEILDKKYESKVELPSIRKNPVIGIVPILNGCNYFCTFCSTKLIKGKLFSYPMDAIRNDVKEHLKSGCKEIWITSNDTGAYMVEQGGNQKIVELLDNVLSIPMDFMLRVGMMNPGNTITVLDELIEVYKNPKMFRFLHIPVQAGNNEVLKQMNRRYSVEDFIKIVEEFRKEIPDITISTDIIVGFPAETEEQFQDSLNLIKKIRFDTVNISRYAAREGTISAKMNQIPPEILKERSREMTKVFYGIMLENNMTWIGKKCKVIIDEIGTLEGSWIGRNECYRPVIVKGDYKLGDILDVEIFDATKFDLRGKEC